jgi:hypothetical protein
MRRVLTALLGALVVMAVAGFPIYVRPQQDPLRADAVVVLGGSHSGARYQRGFSWPTPAGRTIWCCRIPTGPTRSSTGCAPPRSPDSGALLRPRSTLTPGEARQIREPPSTGTPSSS